MFHLKSYMHFIPALLAVLTLLRCDDNPLSSTDLGNLSPNEKRVIESGNDFGFRLFPRIAGAQVNQNVFISPLSASMALGMIYNGAAGETQAAMARGMVLSGLTVPEVNAAYQRVMSLLISLDPDVRMDVANSIWYRQNFTFEPAFLDAGRNFYDARISGMDFNSTATINTINQWVSDQTGGRVTDIVDRIDPLTVMFLINAIYFKGDWTNKFDGTRTIDGAFTKPDGSSVTVRMMRQEQPFDYYENETIQAIDLPYGSGEYSMAVILPKSGRDINAIIESLDRSLWDTWTENFSESIISLWLPRFRLEYERTMNDDLKALGMAVAFNPDLADFTNMYSPGGLYISNVKQKAFLEVTEEGTEAAAATNVEAGVKSAPNVMRVDRSFIFAIRERRAGTVLFIGKIVDPSA